MVIGTWSRPQYIVSTHQLHLWPPGGQLFCFYCVHSTEQNFQPIFKFTPNVHDTLIQTQIHFHHQLVTFVATRGAVLFFCVHSTESSMELFKFKPNIQLTKIQTPIHFCHSLVIFCATSGPTWFFLNPNTILSLINTRRPGSKGQGWNMTYAADDHVAGGGPGIHHRFAHNQTLLVLPKMHNNKNLHVIIKNKTFVDGTNCRLQIWKIFMLHVDTSLKNNPAYINQICLISVKVTATIDIFNGNEWHAPLKVL